MVTPTRVLADGSFLIGENMNEHFHSPLDNEAERRVALDQLIDQYAPEDKDFIADMDEEETIGYLYGLLLGMGEDPDVVLKDFGVTEDGENDEV